MRHCYIVFDKMDMNYNLPFVAIYDNVKDAQKLVDEINSRRRPRIMAWFEAYPMNGYHPRFKHGS